MSAEKLINYLLNENPKYSKVRIPTSENEQFRLYRSLVNIRLPSVISEEYLAAEDEYLRQKTAEKGITDIADLSPVEDNIYLWRGDITTLKCGAAVNAANSGMTGCYQSCLKIAVQNGIDSIAFCCISTGVFGFPKQEAAEIAVYTVRDFLKSNGIKVIFNVFGSEDYDIYRKILGKN